ncbi:IS1 family transposase [Candidatus Kaiserbacteria bacterium]|nr:IS1 family transposase [Candidatus Kaiserbacteria bacterium]
MAARKKAEVIKQASVNERPKYGYCPQCGSGWVIKKGVTTNAGSEKQRYTCRSCGYMTTAPLKEPPKPATPMRHTLPRAKRYIITAAQNATPIHKPTWATLLQCAKYYDAEIVVIPGRYKNPTSLWSKKNMNDEWWDKALQDYLYSGWFELNERLVIVGDCKVEWASRNPLSGMDALTEDMSGIVGHGMREMRSIPTPQYKHPKIMYTTGTCTVANYTDTKRGRIARPRHCLGALLVEVDGKTFFARQLDANKNGSFIDLDMEFTPDEVRPAKRALGLCMGDIHRRWILPAVVRATFTAPDSMVKLTNPENLFWHDTIDGHARNHHHEGNWVIRYGKWKFGIESVRTEIEEAINFVNQHTTADRKSFIVPSNHDKVIDKWLNRVDFRNDPVNIDHYLDSAKKTKDSVRLTEGGITYNDPFISFGRTLANKNVLFLEEGESKVLARVDYGFHGDKGPGGSRGTTANLSRMGVKVSKGHNHTAEIINGCYSVGKSTGMLEYEKGAPSAHTNSHILQYANGKRTIITIINGRFCLPRPKKN